LLEEIGKDRVMEIITTATSEAAKCTDQLNTEVETKMFDDYPQREAKQVIVVRKDLKMNVGKAAAQISHASMAPLTNRLRADDIGMPLQEESDVTLRITFVGGNPHDEAFLGWVRGQFAKVVLGVDTEEELREIIAAAEAAGVPHVAIVDEGRTAFHGVPTLTCVSFGPTYPEFLDNLTGHLKLYNVKGK
jgi:PTH2 family peptidyl-tRNA hydrolase